jgi:hypothetical protein
MKISALSIRGCIPVEKYADKRIQGSAQISEGQYPANVKK